jgi:hypothetical protein
LFAGSPSIPLGEPNDPSPTQRALGKIEVINLGGCMTSIPHRAHRLPLPRKEVIQPHLPVRLPCYDFVPVTNPTFDGCLLAVGPPASGVIGFHDVTGGVYKAREHIHRRMLTGGY